ncbi:catalase family protein [Pseudomaricurvus sp. HS19]|uniref:catalase family protein n=1 Tax=Pseudomaricurvus sp. HS19 TaxID=2692626 RepID=UPI00136F67B1|nr:catalase family protein [Pseudomaricurvus sp. HS19]MYM64395.1 catalase [Pseudomaricurvus sp. HS19]
MKLTILRPLGGLLLSTLLPIVAAADDAAGTTSVPEWVQQLDLSLPAGEQKAIVSAMHSSMTISNRAEETNGLPYRRDAHAKATACVRATFTVNGDIPARYRHSVLSEPGREYKAWVRFSNGDFLVRPDNTPDARGMAVKVMGVEGDPIAPEFSGPPTQDFIMTNSPAFFNRNVFDYADTATYLAKFDRTGGFIGLLPPRLHWPQLLRAKQTVSTRIDNPLGTRYYSMLPYQLGNTVLKFSSRPCSGSHYPPAENKDHPDFLTTQVKQSLENGAACFEFMVQPKVTAADMPVDDATTIWSEQDSPFIPVARLHIPPQQLGGLPQQEFCENLSMNPWHGVGDWQPLSSLNRARRVVYNAVSQFRHGKNQVAVTQPDSWCVPGAEEPCSDQQGLIIHKPKWPLPRCFDHLAQPVDGSTLESECGSEGYGAQGDKSYAESDGKSTQ